jgi:hypothetical protein
MTVVSIHALKVYVGVVIMVHSFWTSGLGTRGIFHSPEGFLRRKESRRPLNKCLVWPYNRLWNFRKRVFGFFAVNWKICIYSSENCPLELLWCYENNQTSYKIIFSKYYCVQYLHIYIHTDLSLRKRTVYTCTLTHAFEMKCKIPNNFG